MATPTDSGSTGGTYATEDSQRAAWNQATTSKAATRDKILRDLCKEPHLAADIDAAIGTEATNASVLRAWINRSPRTEAQLERLLSDDRTTIAAAIAGTPGLNQTTYQELGGRGHFFILETLGANPDVDEWTYRKALQATRIGFTLEPHQQTPLAEALHRHPEAARQASTDEHTDAQIRAVIITAGLADRDNANLIWTLLSRETDTPINRFDPSWAPWYHLARDYLGESVADGAASVDAMIERLRAEDNPNDRNLFHPNQVSTLIGLLQGAKIRRAILEACRAGEPLPDLREANLAMTCAFTTGDTELANAMWSNLNLAPLPMGPVIGVLTHNSDNIQELAAARGWRPDAVAALLINCTYSDWASLLDNTPQASEALRYAVDAIIRNHPERWRSDQLPWLASEHLADGDLLRLPWTIVADNEPHIAGRIRTVATQLIGDRQDAWTVFTAEAHNYEGTFGELLTAVAAHHDSDEN